jgi:hypothetical protein
VNADIVGARRLGMLTVLRDPKAQSRTHRTADHVIRTMTDLWQILPLLCAARQERADCASERNPALTQG